MADRLISADALQKIFNEVSSGLLAKPELSKDAEHIVRACLMVTKMIQDAPTIEAEPNSCEYWDSESRFCALRRPQAEPVKHGRWIESWGGKWHSCSVCGGIPPFNLMGEDIPTPYCPHCGAKMDESTMGQLKPTEAVNNKEDNQ